MHEDSTDHQGARSQAAKEQAILLGARLREARRIADLDLAEAAKELDISAERLAECEAGRSPPRLKLVMLATTLYGTTMDYLCGFRTDSDRDPAVALQALLTARVSADMQTLARRMVGINVDAVRAMYPTTADGERLAAAVLAASSAIDTFRRLNKFFDKDLRGGADLVAKVEAAQVAAVKFMATTARARRKAQTLELTPEGGPEPLPDMAHDQFNPLPALDLLALPQHLVERTATCHAEAD